MKKWEYKFIHHVIVKKISMTSKGTLEEYARNIKIAENDVNKLAEQGWELFSSEVTAFNSLVFILRRKR